MSRRRVHLCRLVPRFQDTHTPARQSVVIRFDCFRIIARVILRPVNLPIDGLGWGLLRVLVNLPVRYDAIRANHTSVMPRPLVSDPTLDIAAEPAAIIAAFFDPAALSHWWTALRSVTAPRTLGVYAIEWVPTPFRD